MGNAGWAYKDRGKRLAGDWDPWDPPQLVAGVAPQPVLELPPEVLEEVAEDIEAARAMRRLSSE